MYEIDSSIHIDFSTSVSTNLQLFSVKINLYYKLQILQCEFHEYKFFFKAGRLDRRYRKSVQALNCLGKHINIDHVRFEHFGITFPKFLHNKRTTIINFAMEERSSKSSLEW